MSDYRKTCPQRTIVTVHHTTRTWLPVTLDCGHTNQINWTARVGQTIGCTDCQYELDHASSFDEEFIDATEGEHNLEQSLERGYR